MKKEEMKFLDEIASIGFANRTRNEQEELERQKTRRKIKSRFSITKINILFDLIY